MITGGMDIGSRFIKYIILEDDKILEAFKEDTGTRPLEVCNKLLKKRKADKIIATGYGRYLLEIHNQVRTITEIKAVAMGAKHIFPICRTIIDIGGQDTKAISLNEKGDIISFEMNDRCAAGTGKFLEVMAATLGYKLEEFGEITEKPKRNIKINSMCTVFAESEVISLIARGEDKRAIVYALHNSIANRIVPLAGKAGIKEDIIFAGGCARNPTLKKLLEERFNKQILVYENPDIMAAIGAALYASKET